MMKEGVNEEMLIVSLRNYNFKTRNVKLRDEPRFLSQETRTLYHCKIDV